MFYRQQIKDVKRTGEENVKWLDNTDNYKQHNNNSTGLLLLHYVLSVKIKHLSGQ